MNFGDQLGVCEGCSQTHLSIGRACPFCGGKVVAGPQSASKTTLPSEKRKAATEAEGQSEDEDPVLRMARAMAAEADAVAEAEVLAWARQRAMEKTNELRSKSDEMNSQKESSSRSKTPSSTPRQGGKRTSSTQEQTRSPKPTPVHSSSKGSSKQESGCSKGCVLGLFFIILILICGRNNRCSPPEEETSDPVVHPLHPCDAIGDPSESEVRKWLEPAKGEAINLSSGIAHLEKARAELGPNHLLTATIGYGLAKTYVKEKRYEEAEELYEHTVSILELADACQGEGDYNYPHYDPKLTYIVLVNFAKLYAIQEKNKEAEDMLKQADMWKHYMME
jgi:tetratricopeptide (TPR) repeat protein